MKYLVYGILPATSGAGLAGLEGKVTFVRTEGLTAACSLRSQAETTPEVSQLLAFARVIEALGRLGTILPMRYGCWLDSEAAVVDLLRRRNSAFTLALREVDGCVEMGVRVKPAPVEPSVVLHSGQPPPLANGTAYLAHRQAHFAAHDQGRLEVDGLSEVIAAAFAGLFVKFKTEGGSGQPCPLLSLHFLIRTDKVEPFRMAFRQLQAARPEQLLLSGPWPPYNFVAG